MGDAKRGSDRPCARVYDGRLPFETTRVDASKLERPRTAIMLNLGNPELAFRTAMLPNDGVGLARMEFIISEHIGVHPMALVNPDKVTSAEARAAIEQRVRNYPRPADYFTSVVLPRYCSSSSSELHVMTTLSGGANSRYSPAV